MKQPTADLVLLHELEGCTRKVRVNA
jgi:hypothetical protein